MRLKLLIATLGILDLCIAVGLIFYFQGHTQHSVTPSVLHISSTAFKNQKFIPSRYTCEGENINPPIVFSEIPGQTKSLALIVDDPDAPSGNWVHWLIWNIDPVTSEIQENTRPKNAIEGTNSFGNKSWGGPCPPSGIHRYFFKVYALDIKLDIESSADKQQLERAMDGHILAKAALTGLYEKKNGRL